MTDPALSFIIGDSAFRYFLCSPRADNIRAGMPRRVGPARWKWHLCIVVANNFEISFSVRGCVRGA